MAAVALALVTLALTGAAAEATLPPLPLFPALPDPCGRVEQVQSGDTCATMAARTGITVDLFKVLNPLVLCDAGLFPGSAVCTGNTIAFCNDVVVAAPGDTCTTIASGSGTVINVDGTNSTTCKTLSGGVPVCVSPAPSKCAVSSLCGTSLSSKLQGALELLTDYCSIVAECKSPFAVGKSGDKDVLTLNVNAVTPAVLAVKDKDGHPELAEFVANPTGVTLGVEIITDWFADGGAAVTIGPLAPARRLSRKLQATGYIRRPVKIAIMQMPKQRIYR